MSNLEKKGDRYVTDDVPNSLKYLKIRKSIEGGARRLVDGRLSFAATRHNLETWKSVFGDIQIQEEEFLEVAKEDTLPFSFKRKQSEWQKSAFERAKDKHVFLYSYQVGLGKSKSLVDHLCYLYSQGKIDRAIIVTPSFSVSYQWSEKAFLVDSSIEYSSYLYRPKDKKHSEFPSFLSEKRMKVLFINIDGVKTKNGQELLNKFITRTTAYCIDEIHKIKNHQSGNYKFNYEFSRKCNYRFGLTGTPIANNLIDIYNIFKFLDEDIVGCKYLTTFKRKYCELKWNGFADEIIGYKNINEFQALINPYLFRYTQKEAGLDKVFLEFEYELTKEQKTHIRELKKEFKTKLENGEFSSVSIALSAMLRIRQISSGFLTDDSGKIQKIKSNKLDALGELIDEIGDNKVLVWCSFKEEVNQILERFGGVDLSGNVSGEERVKNKDLFVKDKSVKIAVGTPDSSGTGIDGLQDVCHYAIYYSNGFSRILREQSIGRTSRLGGKEVPIYYDMIGKGSLDRKILNMLNEKEELSRTTLDDVRWMVDDE